MFKNESTDLTQGAPPCPYMDSTRPPWRERGTREWTAGEITAYKASPNVLLEIKDGMRVDSRQVCRIFPTLFASILVWFVFFLKKEALRLAILTIWLSVRRNMSMVFVCLLNCVCLCFFLCVCLFLCACLPVCKPVLSSTHNRFPKAHLISHTNGKIYVCKVTPHAPRHFSKLFLSQH